MDQKTLSYVGKLWANAWVGYLKIKFLFRTFSNQHKLDFYHPCEHGSSCKVDKKKHPHHRHNFVHPCRYQHNCQKLSDYNHCIKYAHYIIQTPQIVSNGLINFSSNNYGSIVRTDKNIWEKRKCKFWLNCKKSDDLEHKKKFYHPCKFGKNCTIDLKAAPNHMHRFVHPCKFQYNCKKLNDKNHCVQFSHFGVYGFGGVVTTTTKTPVIEKKIWEKKKCKDWDFCTKTRGPGGEYHSKIYYHPCAYGVNCNVDLKKYPNHKHRFTHPCEYQKGCDKLNKLNHCIQFSHDLYDKKKKEEKKDEKKETKKEETIVEIKKDDDIDTFVSDFVYSDKKI